MKKILIIFSLVFIAFLYSCDESSITDPNVKKTPVNPGGGGGNPITNNFYQARDLNFFVMESYYGIFSDTEIEWRSNHSLDRSNILFDTTDNKVRIFIDIAIRSTAPDIIFSFRNDRITGISTIVDTIEINNSLINRSYSELPRSNFEVHLKDLRTGRTELKTKSNSFGAFAIILLDEEHFEINMIFDLNRNVGTPENSETLKAFVLIEGQY